MATVFPKSFDDVAHFFVSLAKPDYCYTCMNGDVIIWVKVHNYKKFKNLDPRLTWYWVNNVGTKGKILCRVELNTMVLIY